MSKTLISESEYLFALCITDGVLEEMDERERSLVLMSITETLKKDLSADRDRKSIKKYQNNEDGQNNGKVSK